MALPYMEGRTNVDASALSQRVRPSSRQSPAPGEDAPAEGIAPCTAPFGMTSGPPINPISRCCGRRYGDATSPARAATRADPRQTMTAATGIPMTNHQTPRRRPGPSENGSEIWDNDPNSDPIHGIARPVATTATACSTKINAKGVRSSARRQRSQIARGIWTGRGMSTDSSRYSNAPFRDPAMANAPATATKVKMFPTRRSTQKKALNAKSQSIQPPSRASVTTAARWAMPSAHGPPATISPATGSSTGEYRHGCSYISFPQPSRGHHEVAQSAFGDGRSARRMSRLTSPYATRIHTSRRTPQ